MFPILNLEKACMKSSPQMETHTLGGAMNFDKVNPWTILLRSSKKENNGGLPQRSQALQRLREAAEKAKLNFQLNWAEINNAFITQGANGH